MKRIYKHWCDLCARINQHNTDNVITTQYGDDHPLKCVVVIDQSSFDKEYSEESRSYMFRSDNKYFVSGMGGNSIFASSLDGTDVGVRLDWYLNKWKIEYCYILEDEESE